MARRKKSRSVAALVGELIPPTFGLESLFLELVEQAHLPSAQQLPTDRVAWPPSVGVLLRADLRGRAFRRSLAGYPSSRLEDLTSSRSLGPSHLPWHRECFGRCEWSRCISGRAWGSSCPIRSPHSSPPTGHICFLAFLAWLFAFLGLFAYLIFYRPEDIFHSLQKILTLTITRI